jgi:7-carboxy-7-deazaguanine synthase
MSKSDEPSKLPWYQVNEIFTSIQGEGVLTGRLSTFIRLQGCPVGCPWCDSGPLADEEGGKRTTNGETRNTWGRGGLRMIVPDIVQAVKAKHVVITGGEPTIWNLDNLIHALQVAGHSTQLETSGLSEMKGKLDVDHLTWSPKKMLDYKAPKSIMLAAKEVKWVVDDELELDTVMSTFDALMFSVPVDSLGPLMPTFVLMPEGSPPKVENIAKCMQWLSWIPVDAQPHFRFGDRLQYRLGIQ